MAELPQHPEADGLEEPDVPTSALRGTYLWWVAGGGLVVVTLVLHLTGVFGPGSH